MSEAHAVTIARAHVEAWSNHDYDEARKSLAADVKVTVTTTIEGAPKTDLAGVDDYMRSLIEVAKTVGPAACT